MAGSTERCLGGVLGDFVRSLAHRIASFPAAGHAAVKDRVNAIALASTEEFRSDSISSTTACETHGRKAGLERRCVAASKREKQN